MAEKFQTHKERLVNKLKSLDTIYLRGMEKNSKDLDLFVYEKNIPDVKKYLIDENFVLFKKDDSKIAFFKVFGKDILIIDLAYNFDYIFRYFNRNLFKKDFIGKFLKNPRKYEIEFDTLRYLFMFRKGSKYSDFLKKHKKIIIENNFFLKNLEENPFKRQLNWKFLNDFLKEDIKILFKILKFKFFNKYIKHKLKIYFKAFNSGQTVVFLGADGVGKTTIINILNTVIYAQKTYMGSRDYIFEFFYPKIFNKNKFFSFIHFISIYLENLYKCYKNFLGKIKGKVVLIDRYPSFQYYMQKKDLSLYLNILFYKYLFPKPDKIIVLYYEPRIVAKRKNERSIEAVKELYKEFRRNLDSKKYAYFVKNEEINSALCRIVEIIGVK